MLKGQINRREEALLKILTHGQKYGRELRELYQRRVGTEMPLGSLYTTLERMEQQGLIKSCLGDSVAERGGNRRKYFSIAGLGTDALNALQRTQLGDGPMPKGVPSHG